MRSRKLLSRGLSAILLISFLGGCSQDCTEKKAVHTAYAAQELIVQKSLDQYSAPSEATVTVNGVTYTGTYAATTQPYIEICNSNVYHTYKGDGFTFRIGADDKKFQQLTLHSEKHDTCTFNKTECREAADAIADDYISLDEYTVSYAAYTEHHHYFDYYREVSGYKTYDRMLIGFNCNGDLIDVDLWLLGTFENVKDVNIDEKIVQQAIEESVRKDLEDRGSAELDRVEINSMGYLTKTDAVQCAMGVSYQYSLKTECVENGNVGGFKYTMFVIADHTKRNWFKP